MTAEFRIILFVLATLVLMWISRASLRNVRAHGFYRFFAWELILILFLMNMNEWFVDPFSFRQIISWMFLIVSLVFIYLGVQLFRRRGRLDPARNDASLVGIEKTTKLVMTGIYGYIRHPFYSSLLFLGWGILLKRLTWQGMLLAVMNTVLLTITARIEEVENLKYFGEKYQQYMSKTKMFIPYII
jgi:protein-S-isoprenylcysteine O-methyltransferase Ste14